MNILRMTKYLVNINFRDFGYWFWTLCYPLLLCGLFMMTTSSMTDTEMENIELGMEAGQPLGEVLEEIDFIYLTHLTESEAVEAMKSGELDGYLHGDNELLVTDTGFNQTIIESVLNEIQQVEASGIPYQNFDYGAQFVETSSQDSEPETILFYALISMIAFYGMFSGIEFMSTMQPHLSAMGARFAASPFSKVKLLFASITGSLTLNLFSNIVVVAAIIGFYQVELFTRLWPTLFLLFAANLTGIGFGLAIGLVPRINTGIKTTISVIFILGLSFLAGMMGPFIKVIIDDNLPLLNSLNPVALLTDTMYRVNFLDNFNDYWMTLGILGLYATVFFAITLLVLRRKRYDSI